MSIRNLGLTGVFLSLGLVLPGPASACRGVEPEELKEAKADAIILAQISKVEVTTDQWRRWTATADKRADVRASTAQQEFTIVDKGPGGCGPGQPEIGAYWLLYLRKQGDGLRTGAAWPFWWARRSGDHRLTRLNDLLPLGIVRAPTAEENKIIDGIERTTRLPEGVKHLSGYTRIYSRASPMMITAKFLKSRTPQRLVTDITEQGPTEASCKCKIIDTLTVDFSEEELRSWGQLSTSERSERR